jgi:hypothetical protein
VIDVMRAAAQASASVLIVRAVDFFGPKAANNCSAIDQRRPCRMIGNRGLERLA